jgi:integrase
VARRRSANVPLPKDIQPVKSRHGNRVYYYYTPGRGTKNPGKRIALGTDLNDPEFWRRFRDAKNEPTANAGTFAALMDAYKKSPEWDRHRPATKTGYTHFLHRIEVAAGDRQVGALTRRDVYELLDSMKATPRAANFMLSVLSTIIEWGIPRGYRDDNPLVGIKRRKVDEGGHSPWPEQGWYFVQAHAPLYLRRVAYLGRVTGQRVSDLVKMRPADLAADGIYLRIGKLRDRKHFVPLTADQMTEIKSWSVRDLDFFITTMTGKRCTERYLNKLWNAWRETDEAKPIRDLTMTIHGLRATKIADLRLAGTDDGAIADELGMSVKMVARYLRFADKVASARASRDRRERKAAEFVKPKLGLKNVGD